MSKNITRFNPLDWAHLAEYERHYQDVHTAFVRGNLRYADIGI